MDVKRIVGWPRRLFLWPALLAMGLAGCASTPPAGPSRPGTQGVARNDLQHYPLALGQVSTGAVPREQPAPVYPPSLLDRRLPPREVLARLIVDEQGRVSEVRMAGEAPADADTRLFDEAVRAAVMQWRFEPLRVNQWAADAGGNTHVVGSETRPFSMDYVFRFAWKDGKPVTDASASPHSPK
ncbi:TonB family C-terminal domain-containing protein [Dyella jiangningensis]|uniref:TonB family protein n=1 Tax=Dyella sp. AtDHG13 TaxID=1938897 RepID=UPI00088F9D4F|nr:TonB family protein [Dyella sp. AtDHG13]PXV55401.1 TonB family protein [Dyella sp. AtDHG13]SDK77849.1 TonB family C-terminal domain-containing protein [Dyella jiangningensis]